MNIVHTTAILYASLARAFERTGFDVCDMGKAFGGQFLWIEAVPTQPAGDLSPTVVSGSVASLSADVAAFASKYRRKTEDWRRLLSQYAQAARRVVVWGTGSKGVTFLNILQAQAAIEYAVDINPRKHGMYVAGTGQEIVPPELLRQRVQI